MAHLKNKLKEFQSIVKKINEIEINYNGKSQSELISFTDQLKVDFKNGVTLDELLVPAFAIVREAALTTCVCLAFIGTPIAYFLAFSSGKLNPIIESIITLPLVLPPTVIGFYLIVFFSPDTKLGNFFILVTYNKVYKFMGWYLLQ